MHVAIVIPSDAQSADWEAEAVRALGEHIDEGAPFERRASTAASAARFLPLAGADADPWCTPALVNAAKEAVARLAPDRALVECVLTQYVKPQFGQRSARARVDARGRTQSGAAAPGEHPAWATEDTLDPGVWNVLGWCIATLHSSNLDAAAWEGIWPLVIPPVMMLLDDAQLHLKVRGVQNALELVEAAPYALLQRTGIAALLDDALAHAFFHMAEPVGPALLRLGGTTRQVLAMQRPPAEAFGALCAIYADGVLGALSYCGPAAAAAPALIPAEVLSDTGARMPTLTSPRLQQVLASSAVALALDLSRALGLSTVRYWNATMEWCTTWIDSAFSACTQDFPHAHAADLTRLVDEATGAREGERASDDGWTEAGDVLIESVCAATLLAHTLVAFVLEEEPPTRFPGLDGWCPQLLAALCKCWIRLEDTAIGARYTRVTAHIASLYTLLMRDDRLRHVGDELRRMDKRLSGLARDT